MSDIQKQLEIRDLVDTTPLREKLLEVKNWEKSMKQKEKDLKARNKVETNETVPIRSRIKENGQATDPATSDPPTVNGNGIQDNKNEALKLAQERSLSIKLAHEEKERGNKLVAAKDYSSAIPHYSKAIELNANDPAFFLNRALCHLRLDDFNSAIADCDSALKLDKSLTKAHFRRMQSHIKLAKYDEALGDCIQMIKLDPKNPDLRKEFDRIKQLKIDKDNGGKAPSAVVGKPKSAEESYWEPRVQKLWSKFGPDEEEIRFQDKAPHLRSKKPLKRISITETFTAPEPVETFPDHIVDKIFNNFTGESTSDGPAASSSRSPVALFSPYTPLYGSFNAPKSPVIPTPPSPMSSSALNLSSCSADRSIDDIFGGITIASKDKPDQDEEPMVLGCQPPPDLELQTDKTDAMKPVVSSPPTPNRPARSFEIPKTGVQFADVWKGLDELERFQFLRQCQEGSKIVGQLDASLDDSLFSELLDTMHSYFCPKDLNIGDMLVQLSRNSEIGILAMMMGDIERRTVEDLLNYVKGRQELTPEVLTDLERAFSG